VAVPDQPLGGGLSGLAQPHHDGSELYVDRLGDSAELRLRAAEGSADAVLLRYVEDGEPRTVKASVDARADGEVSAVAAHSTPQTRPSTVIGTPTVERPPAADGKTGRVQGSDHSGSPVRLVAKEGDRRNLEDLHDLLRDCGEDVGAWRALRDERRHPSQCGLLVGKDAIPVPRPAFDRGCHLRSLTPRGPSVQPQAASRSSS